MQKIFSPVPRYKLRGCSQFIECRKILHDGDIYIFLPTRFASAIWAGSTNTPALFLQILVSASPLRQLSWCLTNSCVHKERKKFDGRYRVTGRLGAFLLLFFSFLKGMHGRGPNKIETHSESMRCPKFDLTYKRSGFEG